MNRQDWLARARVTADRHTQAPSGVQAGHGLQPEIERVLLAELHALVCAAPLPLLDEFRHCTEEALAARTEPCIDPLWEERFDWAPEEGDDAAAWLMAAIVQVRALDQALAQGLSDASLGPRLDPRQWAVPQHGAYVVPRSPWRLDGSAPKQGEPYSRRGLRHHAVLPMEVGGLRVRPVHLPSGPLPGGRLALGAALFRAPELRLRAVEDGPHGRGFLAEGFAAADVEAAIEPQATAAFAAVWPELTMPPEARQPQRTSGAREGARGRTLTAHGPQSRRTTGASWRLAHEFRRSAGHVGEDPAAREAAENRRWSGPKRQRASREQRAITWITMPADADTGLRKVYAGDGMSLDQALRAALEARRSGQLRWRQPADAALDIQSRCRSSSACALSKMARASGVASVWRDARS